MMDFLLPIIKSIGVIILIYFVAINLIGLLLRTIYHQKHINQIVEDNDDLLKESIDKYAPKRAFTFMTLVSSSLILLAIFLFYKYLGIYVAIAFLLTMVFRIPDLIDDIHGRKIDKKRTFLTLLTWIPIILIIYNYIIK